MFQYLGMLRIHGKTARPEPCEPDRWGSEINRRFTVIIALSLSIIQLSLLPTLAHIPRFNKIEDTVHLTKGPEKWLLMTLKSVATLKIALSEEFCYHA